MRARWVGAEGLSRQSRSSNQIGIWFNCRLPVILDACSYKVMENDKYLSPLWQQPFIFPHCHQAFPARLSGGKSVSRYYIRVKAGLGSCQLLHSQHSWEERLGEEV